MAITFLDMIRKAGISETDNIKRGEIVEVSFDQSTLRMYLTLVFPNILPINELIDFKRDLKKFLIEYSKVADVFYVFKYQSKDLSNDLLTQYYDYCLKTLIEGHSRFTVLRNIETKIDNNQIVLYIANSKEKSQIEELLVSVNSMLKDFGISTIATSSISAFATPIQSILDAHNERTKQELIQEQESYDRQNIAQPEQPKKEEKKFRYSPKKILAINKVPTPISQLPSSNADLIIFKQQNGNSELCITGVIEQSEIRSITSKKDAQVYQLFVGILRQGNYLISIKTFINKHIDGELERFQKCFIKGAKVRCGGEVTFDNFSKDIVFQISQITLDDTVEDNVVQEINDNAPVKRVELHAHTKMSVQDGVMDVEEYVKQAAHFGHKACAITDMHNIQALPDFYNACKANNIKPIFGLEGEFVDEDKYKIALTENEENNKINLHDATYVVYDLETTGFSSNYNEIIEIAAAKIKDGVIVDTFSTFVKPKREIGSLITDLTSITNDDVRNAESIEVLLPKFYEFCRGSIIVAHNATFDNSHFQQGLARLGIDAYDMPSIDTLQLLKVRYGHGTSLKRFNLDAMCKYFDVELKNHHRAINDATATAYCFIKMLNDLFDSGVNYYGDINKIINDEAITDLAYPSHITILSKNAKGKKSLYQVVSDSSTTHFYKQPLIVKSYLEEHRDGLLIGSACIDGDVFKTAYEKSYKELLKVMEFYDYIEIQPVSVCSVLVERYQDKKVYEFIQDTIKKIIKAAKELGKIVVATGNVHELTEEDLVVRKIYIDAPQIGGGVHPLKDILQNVPSMHFMTTEEMLDEFSFLGEDIAYEVVVTNTNKIADMVEEYDLFPKDLLVPADDMLKDKGVPSFSRGVEETTYNTAREIYGENLPQIIDDRIKKELDVIIGKGYASIYYLSHMLVKHSTDSGYVVGSRGSVGSSLVAYFMHITEVNGLPPHYLCPHCHFMAMKLNGEEKELYPMDENQLKFDETLQKAGTGYDLPIDRCPVCGEPMLRMGVDIPFETFLGTKSDSKVPDIDLNFSGEFQAKAHEYCRSMFGVDHAFRAGTILTIAEKTAYGYVKNYFERQGKEVRKAEIDSLVTKVQGVKRSSSKHPGGIVVFPLEIDYTDVIPVQYPADDPDSNWRTTHFDYHKFEHNLLKFDILGHDDPTMIRYLMNFVHQYPDEFEFSNVEDIPILDPNVFGIFNSVKPLGVTPEEIGGEDIGTTGIPEFGTKIAKDMLRDAKPTTYADLLKLSGLAHGEGVWGGNARDFLFGLKEGFDPVPFSELIGCRDDIMVYLISKGVPSSTAFKIMEKVRKGKGVSAEFEQVMVEHNVPRWYIESCKLIQYMFPKAHATAYVIMALRIAWFKVNKPLYYYSAFLSRRAKAQNVEVMVNGADAIRRRMAELAEKQNARIATAKEEDENNCLRVVLEAVARGVKFKMIDINESEAADFICCKDENALLIPFNALDSLGDACAISIVEARKEKPFTSKRDVIQRTKLNKSQFEMLDTLGAFGSLPNEDESRLNISFN